MPKRRLARRHALSLAAVLWSAVASAQGVRGGTIVGEVRDSTVQRPLPLAEVYIAPAGATLVRQGTRTGSDGKYTLAGVAAGAVTVRVRLVGYAPKQQTINVVDGQTV